MHAKSLAYNPAIDGLRALAIALVIATHVGLPKVGGYHGVTVFFVISGYLITSLLLNEYSNFGALNLRHFYWRRFARLAPAMVLVIGITLAWLLAVRQPFSTYWAGLVGSLTYTTNIFETTEVAESIDRAFEWSWSLSVEEQFYLVWPILLLVVLRARRFRTVLVALALTIPAEWFIRTRLADAGEYRAVYYGPFSHIDALALGVIIALVLTQFQSTAVSKVVGRIAGPVGLIGLAVLFLRPEGLPFVKEIDPGGFGQAAICSAALVLWVVTSPQSIFAKVLATKPFVFIGKLSYGLYLWNMLLVIVFQYFVGEKPAASWLVVPWLIALVGIAYLSWRFVETPLRKKWAPPHILQAQPEKLTLTS